MGGINIKLMQGIDDAENQLQKEKQIQTPKGEEAVRKEAETRDSKETARKPRKSQKAEKQPNSKKSTAMRKNNETDKIQQKQVFSFRAVLNDIVIWKAYAIASGKTIENICNAAMHEYLRKHKLAGAEQMVFDAIKARDFNGGG